MEQKKTITVNLQVKEMIFDVQNKTYLTGRSREAEAEKGYEAASHIQVSDDDENSYQIRRSINNSFSNLKTELAEYLEANSTTTDNLIKDAIDTDGQISLVLKMPSNYNQASADNLGASIHQYIVNKAIADWFSITNKSDVDDYVKQAAEALEMAKRALYKRQRPTRPTYTQE